MWIYEKKLQFPVRIRKPDLRMAKALLAQYGGPDSELAAGIRYLNQRYSMPNDACKSILTDIGTEEPVPHYCRGNKGGKTGYYSASIPNKPYRQ
jgi:Mn-containing catalase